MPHEFRKPSQRAADRLAGRGGRRFSEHHSDLLVVTLHFEARDERGPIRFCQLLQRMLVARHRLATQDLIERRRGGIRTILDDGAGGKACASRGAVRS